ncbi:MAG: hypothetical protein ABI254_14725, partial [Chthoniobacterales bacterium]
MEKSQNKPTIAYLANEAQFWKQINALAGNYEKVRVDDLLHYQWGFLCGNGSDHFYGPRSQALFLALLREKRYREAVGAALEVHIDSAEKFLKLTGLDWEAVVIGGLVDINLMKGGNLRIQRAALLALLGAYGTERSARLLIEIATYENS